MSIAVCLLVAVILVAVAWLVLHARRTRAETRRLHKIAKTYRRIDAIEREASERMRRLGRRG